LFKICVQGNWLSYANQFTIRKPSDVTRDTG